MLFIGACQAYVTLCRCHVTLSTKRARDMTASGRYCCKTPKMPCDQFSAKRRNKRQLPIDVPSSAPTKSLVGSSPIDVAPRMIIRSLRLRAGKIVFGDAKRLLQQDRHQADVGPVANSVCYRGIVLQNSAGLDCRV